MEGTVANFVFTLLVGVKKTFTVTSLKPKDVNVNFKFREQLKNFFNGVKDNMNI